MFLSTYILMLGLIIKASGGKASVSSRSKRYLLTTPDTQYGAFATVSIPLEAESTVSVAWFFEANYYTTANVTYLHPLLNIDTEGRESRDVSKSKEDFISRKYIYNLIEAMFEKHGFGGRACLLRAICENGRSHFLHNGVLGDLLHLLLTPSSSKSENGIEDDFYIAEYLGAKEDCYHYKEECPKSPLDYITLFI